MRDRCCQAVLYTMSSKNIKKQNKKQIKTNKNQRGKNIYKNKGVPNISGGVAQFWKSLPILALLKKSILFNKNVKTNTHNILFVQKASPVPPRSRLLVPGVFKTKLLLSFHSFLVSSFCLPALSPIFHSKSYPHDASVFSHSPVFVCITALLYNYSTSLALSSP